MGLIARGQAGLDGAKREVESAGGQALTVACDVSDAAAVKAAAERIEHELGPIDVWVNVAMTGVFSYIKDMQLDEYKRVTEVNDLGFVYGAQAALQRMLPRNHGRIIMFGSALAYRGIPLQSAYCATKHAIQGLCDSLRAELLAEGTKGTVSRVQMPAINIPQFDWLKTRMPRRAQPVPPIPDGARSWLTFRPVWPSEATTSCLPWATGLWRGPASRAR